MSLNVTSSTTPVTVAAVWAQKLAAMDPEKKQMLMEAFQKLNAGQAQLNHLEHKVGVKRKDNEQRKEELTAYTTEIDQLKIKYKDLKEEAKVLAKEIEVEQDEYTKLSTAYSQSLLSNEDIEKIKKDHFEYIIKTINELMGKSQAELVDNLTKIKQNKMQMAGQKEIIKRLEIFISEHEINKASGMKKCQATMEEQKKMWDEEKDKLMDELLAQAKQFSKYTADIAGISSTGSFSFSASITDFSDSSDEGETV